jgi:hypothetical protein
MNVEQIDEPIRVLAVFSGGGVRPLRFRRAGRTYRINAVNGQWVDRQGDSYSLHFSVQVGGETFLIHFSSREVQWWLDQVVVEG